MDKDSLWVVTLNDKFILLYDSKFKAEQYVNEVKQALHENNTHVGDFAIKEMVKGDSIAGECYHFITKLEEENFNE